MRLPIPAVIDWSFYRIPHSPSTVPQGQMPPPKGLPIVARRGLAWVSIIIEDQQTFSWLTMHYWPLQWSSYQLLHWWEGALEGGMNTETKGDHPRDDRRRSALYFVNSSKSGQTHLLMTAPDSLDHLLVLSSEMQLMECRESDECSKTTFIRNVNGWTERTFTHSIISFQNTYLMDSVQYTSRQFFSQLTVNFFPDNTVIVAVDGKRRFPDLTYQRLSPTTRMLPWSLLSFSQRIPYHHRSPRMIARSNSEKNIS